MRRERKRDSERGEGERQRERREKAPEIDRKRESDSEGKPTGKKENHFLTAWSLRTAPLLSIVLFERERGGRRGEKEKRRKRNFEKRKREKEKKRKKRKRGKREKKSAALGTMLLRPGLKPGADCKSWRRSPRRTDTGFTPDTFQHQHSSVQVLSICRATRTSTDLLQ